MMIKGMKREVRRGMKERREDGGRNEVLPEVFFVLL